MDKTDNVKLSKTLSWILRHGAPEAKINLDPEGYASVEEILRLPQLRNFSTNDVRHVVETNAKQRFSLKTVDVAIDDAKRSILLIKANQGHSLPVPNLELRQIHDPLEFPTVVHGSYYARCWASIKGQGLSRMTRQHIHFARDDFSAGGDDVIVSGRRQDCDLLIFIDLEKALKNGYRFFLSPNHVILCAGNEDGYLPVEFFRKVQRIFNGNRIEIDIL